MALHRWLLASARLAGNTTLRLALRHDNSSARLCYRQTGFREIEHLPGDCGGRVAARRMQLRPTPAA